ncbi:MAG TPA: hypothetical protein VHF46_03555 [Rubrobacteraceae bacterium]|nr:hypothetical protein [Rubrobacteraceae bacterium]
MNKKNLAIKILLNPKARGLAIKLLKNRRVRDFIIKQVARQFRHR